MRLTRRDVSKLALGAALVAQSGPAQAFFHRRLTPETIAKRLAQDLNASIKAECDAEFSVADVLAQDVPFWSIDASVQLDWSPGTRRRLVFGVGESGDEAYEKLLAEAQTHFGEVLAPGNGTACFG